MYRIEHAGFQIVGHVHDEIIVEVPVSMDLKNRKINEQTSGMG